MCKVCGGMSKQRYLLIIILISVTALAGQIHYEGRSYTVLSNDKPAYLKQGRVEVKQELSPDVNFSFSSKLDALDFPLGEFPQTKWLNSYTALNYHKPAWNVEAGYRNILMDSSQELVLYPAWNAAGTYKRRMQHQAQLELNAKIEKLDFNAYGIHKHLRANPIDYTFDPDFNLISNTLPQRGFDDIYYGLAAEYSLLPWLSFSAGSDMKQANFDESDVYSINSIGVGSHLQLKPSYLSHITGDFVWKNQNADNLSPENRNTFQTIIRYQQRFGLQTNGYIGFINNSCSDDKLNQVYLVSNLLRSHVKYNFKYDLSQGSYLLVGGKYSPENENSAVFSEGQWRLADRVYSLVSVNYQLDAQTLYQNKTSYYFSPVSECYVHYAINDSKVLNKTSHYIGIGTSINF